MELGIYHEFPVLPGRSQAECFAAGFDIVDASEEYGLDVMWLAELHFDKRRALAASPLVLGTAIAARTESEAPPIWWTPLLSSGESRKVSNGPGTASFYG